MGISPIFAIPALFKYAGIELKDVGFFELNEAFSSQSLYRIQSLALTWRRSIPMAGQSRWGNRDWASDRGYRSKANGNFVQ
jgi:acetyl-CoA acyltransferase 1